MSELTRMTAAGLSAAHRATRILGPAQCASSSNWSSIGHGGTKLPATRRAISSSSAMRRSGTLPRNASVACRFCGGTARAALALTASRVAAASAARAVASGHSAKNSRRPGSFGAAVVLKPGPCGGEWRGSPADQAAG